MNLHKRIYILLLTAYCALGTAHSQEIARSPDIIRAQPRLSPAPAAPRWQQQVDYTIDVSLNTEEHTLDGFLKMTYSNHSPDTLSFIWIHCWPNAYKNDRTAFSDQLLDNGRTDFYFSDKGKKGYINHLDFRVEGVVAKMEDHPQYIDVIKIILPTPLAPDAQITITTPFHEQLPFPFSGSGYNKGNYQIAQWFPQPAVYDPKGWHPIPYLDQGGSYSEYGDFDVRITLPKNYTVAATGALTSTTLVPDSIRPRSSLPGTRTYTLPLTDAPAGTQTLRFLQKNISGFAWFANPHFQTDHDTLQLPSGRIIDLYTCYTPEAAPLWHPYSMASLKKAIRFRSALIGEYPYDVISIAEILPLSAGATPDLTAFPGMASPGTSSKAPSGASSELSYPTLAGIPTPTTVKALDLSIQHAIGLNWFHSILGPDERTTPWMTQGFNTYYDRRYKNIHYPPGTPDPIHHAPPKWIKNKLPADLASLLVNTLGEERRDQPISTTSEDFTALNYSLIAHTKAALWLERLQDSLGTPLFDSCMQEYFRRWTFQHPTPEDFRTAFGNTGARSLAAPFAQLDAQGPLPGPAHPKKIRPTFLFSGRNTDKISYINIAPAVGYNTYDHFMVGAVIHNFDLPPNAFQFLLAPLYATNSRQFTGAGYLGYSWYPRGPFQKIGLGLEAAKFSSFSGSDSNGNKLFGGFYKIAPSLRLTLKNKTARSTIREWLEWKTYLIGEQAFTGYVQKSTDSLSYPAAISKYHFRYLNQLSFNIEDTRVLYPYRALLQIQQGDRFYRINFTGNYFFNYEAGGGMGLRLFAAKFGYLGGTSSSLDLTSYQPKLTGVSGSEDYTYSNYFVGRNDYTGFSSQQIMIRDGGLKIRVPNFPFLEGRSDNWVSALNLNSTLPSAIVPRWLPLKVFLDIGTYAGAWQDNPLTSRFLYTGGLQLSLFHNVVNFYAPLFYSSDFSDQLKTIPNQNTFFKKLSFSIDLQNISPHQLF
ncbi:MAG TPA: M1 family metallopeptidase [Puia sp.]|nr:M1 family metallopeptidase [Puia sp.]